MRNLDKYRSILTAEVQGLFLTSRYSRMTSLLMNKGIYVESRIVPWGAHCEASWEKQLPHVMSTLLYPENTDL